MEIFFFINSSFWFNFDIRWWALLSYSLNREISWFFNWRSRFCLSHSLTKSVNVLRILTLSLAYSLSRMISSLYSKLKTLWFRSSLIFYLSWNWWWVAEFLNCNSSILSFRFRFYYSKSSFFDFINWYFYSNSKFYYCYLPYCLLLCPNSNSLWDALSNPRDKTLIASVIFRISWSLVFDSTNCRSWICNWVNWPPSKLPVFELIFLL